MNYISENEIDSIKSNWERKSFADKIKQIVCILIGCTMEDLENEEFKNSYLGEEWNCWVVNTYADIVKPMLFLDKEKAYQYYMESGSYYKKPIYRKITVRELLQLIGTEAGREIIHPNIWVNALFSEYREYFKPSLSNNDIITHDIVNKGFPNWLISDVRFPNEIDAIVKRKGKTIRINRHPQYCYDSLEDYLVCYPDKKIVKDAIDIVKFSKSNDDMLNRFKLTFPKETNQYHKDKEAANHYSEIALDSYKDFDYIIDNNGTIEDLILQVKDIMIKEGVIK